MAKQKEIETNDMRILESMEIPFTYYTYECDELVDGYLGYFEKYLPQKAVI